MKNQENNKYDDLKLENQLCFPLYACSKEIIKKYKPYLDKINLTYTQYITMMVLWENNEINVKSLGEKLYLDSGTLTPLLKKLEKKELIKKEKSFIDERVVNVTITDKGMDLKNKAKDIPQNIGKCLNITNEEALELYKILHKILFSIKEE